MNGSRLKRAELALALLVLVIGTATCREAPSPTAPPDAHRGHGVPLRPGLRARFGRPARRRRRPAPRRVDHDHPAVATAPSGAARRPGRPQRAQGPDLSQRRLRGGCDAAPEAALHVRRGTQGLEVAVHGAGAILALAQYELARDRPRWRLLWRLRLAEVLRR